MSEERSFLGTGWSFPPTFNKTVDGSVVMVSNRKDIEQSLKVLLSTTVGERIMLPNYGCNLQEFLFEPITNSKLHFIKDLIKTAVTNFEPRIDVVDIIIDDSGYQEGTIYVKLDYLIRKTNTRFNLVYPYYIIEGTDIPKPYQDQVVNPMLENSNEL